MSAPLQGQIVLPVIMEDAIIHDQDHPYCSDSTCPCQEEREAQRARLPLNGNRTFSLLKRTPEQEEREAAQDRNMTTQLPDGSWW